MSPSYFTCTLDQAAHWNASYASVTELLDRQAERDAQQPAVGFADPVDNRVFTFAHLAHESKKAARWMAQQLEMGERPTVAILSKTSLPFLLTWLGACRLGSPLQLLSPRLTAAEVEQLCHEGGSVAVFADEESRDKVGGRRRILIDGIVTGLETMHDAHDTHTDDTAATLTDAKDTALIFHSSGTSGRPKCVGQSHGGVVGVLPSLPGSRQSSFTTTPLYHGGIADCLRAWASGAMIWLFPEARYAMTAKTILASMHVADASLCPVRYFSAVPFVLKILSEKAACVARLRDMEMVGVGGSAMAAALGDELVHKGVRLVSRYGSVECGFLMSSYRDFDSDKDWQYLRCTAPPEQLCFEEVDGLFELVVRPAWPYLCRTNREDGSYATNDLFEPHPEKRNAWRFHSRADGQMQLANGKKFDPAPFESAVLAASDMLQDVLVVGTGRDFVGLLLFPAAGLEIGRPEELVNDVWPIVERLNEAAESHARIAKFMVRVVGDGGGDGEPVEKSSKGTILRARAEARYADTIEAVYRSSPATAGPMMEKQVLDAVLAIFKQLLGREPDADVDVFHQGIDSIACAHVRHLIDARLLQHGSLPTNAIYEAGSVRALAHIVHRMRDGGDWKMFESSESSEIFEEGTLMKQLVEKYTAWPTLTTSISSISSPSSPSSRPSTGRPSVVVLTGVTGLLGAHILAALRTDTARICCLVRADDVDRAHERVHRSLIDRRLPGLGLPGRERQVRCLCVRIGHSKLGLDETEWRLLISETTLVVHAAWTVNFALRLASFENHIAGTFELVHLAMQARARFVFISSIAAASRYETTGAMPEAVPEAVLPDPATSSPLGYARSKWVAEQVVATAHRNLTWLPQDPPLPRIIRVGQLCGSTTGGVWNASEAWPLLLSTARQTGCLPRLNVPLDWLPVDVAAASIVELARADDDYHCNRDRDRVCVLHVLNKHRSPRWQHLLAWVRNDTPDIHVVDAPVWLGRLTQALTDGRPTVWAPLLRLWSSLARDGEVDVSFSTRDGERMSPTLRGIGPLDEAHVLGLWRWVRRNVA